MKKELEIKDVSPYLAHNVKILRPDKKTIVVVTGVIGNLFTFFEDDVQRFGSLKKENKLVLKPLSEAESVLIECAKLEYPKAKDFTEFSAAHKNAIGIKFNVKYSTFYLVFDAKIGHFVISDFTNCTFAMACKKNREMVNLMLKNHFDINDLHTQGKAVYENEII